MNKVLFILLSWIIFLGCNDNLKTYNDALNCIKRSIPAVSAPNIKKVNMEEVQNCLIGALIPNLKLMSLNNKMIDSIYFKGKVTILNFWFIGCSPCRAEIPGFNLLVEKYGTDKINYLAIGRDTKEDIIEFLESNDWKFDHISDGVELIEKTFKIQSGYPTTFVLNKKGQIILVFSGGFSDKRAITDIQKRLIPILDKEILNNDI
jgi:thiol-disulfide isomerase/thioredoxin